MPDIYKPNSTKPCKFKKPHTVCDGINAAISRAYTGKRAEQVMSGATKIVVKRSRGSLMLRVAIIPGTAQAKLDSKGINERPLKPALNMSLSSRNAARGK